MPGRVGWGLQHQPKGSSAGLRAQGAAATAAAHQRGEVVSTAAKQRGGSGSRRWAGSAPGTRASRSGGEDLRRGVWVPAGRGAEELVAAG